MKKIYIKTIYKNNIDGRFLSEKRYKEIIYMFIKFMVLELLNSNSIRLPFKLGTFEIVGKKQNPKIKKGKIVGLAPDWKSTKELWETDSEAKEKKKLVYFLNENTNHVIYRYFWSKKDSVVKNKILYTFIPSRKNKRDLAKAIKNNKEFRIK